MRTEAALVIALARGDGDLSRFTANAIDWSRVGELAARHQVDALCSWMWRSLRRSGADAPGPPWDDELERGFRLAYLHHLLRNQSLVRDLNAIHDALRSRGIEALYFKGPWLALYAYPDPGTRPIGDIDLGIREGDYRQVVAALTEIGYRSDERLPEGSAEALRQAHYGGQLRLWAPGRRPAELHFRLINMGPPVAEERWVWETARAVAFGSKNLLVPGPQAMLLHLLLHANQHGFSILRLFHDIRWALDRDGSALDPEEFAARVRDLRCSASAYHGLLLARDLAGASVTPRMLDALRPSGLRRAAFTRAWRLPEVRRLERSRSSMEAESPLLYFLEMGRLRDKIHFLTELVHEAGGVGPFLRRTLRVVRRRQSGALGGRGDASA